LFQVRCSRFDVRANIPSPTSHFALRTSNSFAHRASLIALLLCALCLDAAGAAEQLEDLTAGVPPIVTLRHRDNFANEFTYDVWVENRTARPIRGDSLILVVETIVDLAGKDAADRVEVVGQDGYTPDGKPYFRVPTPGNQLAPFGESDPALVRLRNPYYTIVFTPSFRVFGKPVREPRLPAVPPSPGRGDPLNRLIELLIKKGVLTRDEWFGPPAAVEPPASPPETRPAPRADP
jgi:hypothetical protein